MAESEPISATSISLLGEWAFLLKAKSSSRVFAVIALLTVAGRLVGGLCPLSVCFARKFTILLIKYIASDLALRGVTQPNLPNVHVSFVLPVRNSQNTRGGVGGFVRPPREELPKDMLAGYT